MVANGAVTPKPCISPAEMRTRTAADGLLPAGTASTVMRTIFSRPLPSWTLVKEAKGKPSQIDNNQLDPLYCRKVIQTKSRQTLMFDPGGYTCRLRSCPFLRGWHTLRIGRDRLDPAVVAEAGAFSVHVNIISKKGQVIRT